MVLHDNMVLTKETFARVAQMPMIPTFLAVEATRQSPVYQMDMDYTFLHGTLSEVYMTPPPGCGAFYSICLSPSTCYLRPKAGPLPGLSLSTQLC